MCNSWIRQVTKDQIVIGCILAGVCGLGIWNREWLLRETPKGQRLVARYGERKAVRIVTILLGTGFVVGVLLACNILRPLRW
jgi:hypothetical protein